MLLALMIWCIVTATCTSHYCFCTWLLFPHIVHKPRIVEVGVTLGYSWEAVRIQGNHLALLFQDHLEDIGNYIFLQHNIVFAVKLSLSLIKWSQTLQTPLIFRGIPLLITRNPLVLISCSWWLWYRSFGCDPAYEWVLGSNCHLELYCWGILMGILLSECLNDLLNHLGFANILIG